MTERLNELGVAGPVDDDVRGRLRDSDIDLLHSIGLAGPWSPEMLRRVVNHGVEGVVSSIHALGAAGPWDPRDLETVLDVGVDHTVALVHANGWTAIEPKDLAGRLRNGARAG